MNPAKRLYNHNMPIFKKGTDISDRVVTAMENVLPTFVMSAKTHANATSNNPKNYKIDKVYVVGSGAHEKVIDSDLDLLFETPRLSEQDTIALTLAMNAMYFANRPKIEAIDIYVRSKDKFPERASTDITNQVRELLDYNNKQLNL